MDLLGEDTGEEVAASGGWGLRGRVRSGRSWERRLEFDGASLEV